MGNEWGGRTREAERIAGQAFHELVEAVEAGGQGAKALARHGLGLADGASDRLGSASDLFNTAGERLGAAGNRLGAAGDRLGSAMGERRRRAGAAVDESRRRAGAALDALAGRRPPIQWEWVLAGAITGAIAGWLAARLIRRAAEEAMVLEDTESVVADESKGLT